MSQSLDKTMTAQERFEQNLKEKLRNDIGSLLPDEVLAEMVSKTLRDVFFSPVKIKNPNNRSTWGTDPEWVDGPSVLVSMLKEMVTPLLKQHVEAFVAANAEALLAAIQESVSKGVFETAQKYQDAKIQEIVGESLRAVFKQINPEAAARMVF